MAPTPRHRLGSFVRVLEVRPPIRRRPRRCGGRGEWVAHVCLARASAVSGAPEHRTAMAGNGSGRRRGREAGRQKSDGLARDVRTGTRARHRDRAGDPSTHRGEPRSPTMPTPGSCGRRRREGSSASPAPRPAPARPIPIGPCSRSLHGFCQCRRPPGRTGSGRPATGPTGGRCSMAPSQGCPIPSNCFHRTPSPDAVLRGREGRDSDAGGPSSRSGGNAVYSGNRPGPTSSGEVAGRSRT
jgi:hypothetical protein